MVAHLNHHTFDVLALSALEGQNFKSSLVVGRDARQAHFGGATWTRRPINMARRNWHVVGFWHDCLENAGVILELVASQNCPKLNTQRRQAQPVRFSGRRGASGAAVLLKMRLPL
jgi:hypothetical protein